MKKKFRILFLEPNFAIAERPGFEEFMEPLNLCYIAAAAKDDGHEVFVIQQFDKSAEEIVEVIINYNPEILALTFVTCFFNNAKTILRLLKRKNVSVISIAGGSHVAGDPKEVAEFVDFVIVGEGEETFVKLLDQLPVNRTPDIPGLGFFFNESFYLNNTRNRASFFNSFPYRDSLNMGKYTGIGNGPPPMPNVGFASMLLSKGCRFNCDFCINKEVWKDSISKTIPVIKRNPDHVIQEMIMLNSSYNVGYVWFHDPDFPLFDRAYMQRFFEAKKNFGDFKYAFMTRIENILLDTNVDDTIAFLKNLKHSGCHMIGFGLESFSTSIQKEMNKQMALDKVKLALELVFKVGIIPVGFFIIGYPQESEETLNATFEIAKKLKIIRYRFGIFYPFKGTARRKKTVNNDWLIPESNTYDLANHETQVLNCHIAPGKLEAYFLKMNYSIYQEQEYIERLEQFCQLHPDMKPTIDNWRNLINIDNYYK
ncbi:MAG: B12-binding domain-containing radical SAM protein [Bacteroidales bacterium]